MRSRYCAFVLKDYDYLLRTHAPEYLNGLTREALSAEPLPHWLALEVMDTKNTADEGQVTFKAWYRLRQEVDAIYERSSFIRRQGQWFYTQGVQMQARLPGRNELCVCRSGKKFKHCCAK
jgi:SEC-C motif domain protein